MIIATHTAFNRKNIEHEQIVLRAKAFAEFNEECPKKVLASTLDAHQITFTDDELNAAIDIKNRRVA